MFGIGDALALLALALLAIAVLIYMDRRKVKQRRPYRPPVEPDNGDPDDDREDREPGEGEPDGEEDDQDE